MTIHNLRNFFIPWLIITLLLGSSAIAGREFHVSPNGNDSHDGTSEQPVKTISAAATQAQANDTITVHQGVYRERINPPRGGLSDTQRIIYQAAKNETVTIKGSEIIQGWKHVSADTWKVTLSNTFFGDFNPYCDEIRGDWFRPKGRRHHTGAVYHRGHWLQEARSLAVVMKVAPVPPSDPLWFGKVDAKNTTIFAQFPKANPNETDVEINVRQTVFYPKKPGINFITVRGFTLEHAATPWAPPTAEQIGIIGTHWSKGWVIENNTIQYSACVGVTLGKYGDQWDNTSQNAATGYDKTIERAQENGWTKKNIGDHLVHNNRISHCGQAGIVGSLGAIFSTISNNEIHHIYVRRPFTGEEMGGIKLHAPIDTTIKGNHIHHTDRGIWLDWMTQGTRVTGNLLHDNDKQDLFVEVNHGPFLVDHNIFLSPNFLYDRSQGGAYVHNFMAGSVIFQPELTRITPFHEAHSTKISGQSKTMGGDSRFFNNILIKANLSVYDKAKLPMKMEGNLYLGKSKPSIHEKNPHFLPEISPKVKLTQKSDGYYLSLSSGKEWTLPPLAQIITLKILGKASVPNLPFEQPDGSPYHLDSDYFGKKRTTPFPGPFTHPVPKAGDLKFKVWPAKSDTTSHTLWYQQHAESS